MRDDLAALVAIGRLLIDDGYRFVTVTPETHRRVNARPSAAVATDLRGVFGWSRPFDAAVLPKPMFSLLQRADACAREGDRFRSKVRFSTIDGRIFVHSAYPTDAKDAVFFGPDTYRFVSLVQREAGAFHRVVDLGCGSGAAGLVAAERGGTCVLADVNRHALAYAEVNAALAGVEAEIVESDLFGSIAGSIDLVIANPPYLHDAAGRDYRHGGGQLGEGLSVRIVQGALERLEPRGRLIVYTGAPIVAGRDLFHDAIEPMLALAGASYRYLEIDPDVFGEELETAAYATVDRIAAVSLVATLPRTHSS